MCVIHISYRIMAKKANLTRSKDNTWLIGHPIEIITGAHLPSGRDVMKNFLYYHRLNKLTIDESARHVYEQLLPFWLKSRIPVRQKGHIVLKKTFADQG